MNLQDSYGMDRKKIKMAREIKKSDLLTVIGGSIISTFITTLGLSGLALTHIMPSWTFDHPSTVAFMLFIGVGVFVAWIANREFQLLFPMKKKD